MPTVTYIEHDGTEHAVDAGLDESVMQAAVRNMVPGILALCGGNLSCATCHVYVDPAWLPCLVPPARDERDLIECVTDLRENSRLSCQIRLTPALDGLVVRLPQSQA